MYLILQLVASYHIYFIFTFSLSFFILFVTYITGQLQLIKHYVDHLNLDDHNALAGALKEITALHLDVLEKIAKLSKLYTWSIKVLEMIMNFAMALILMGKKNQDIAALSIPILICFLIALYSFFIENIIAAEENIRDAYYELNWLSASIKSRKTLLLAMHQPRVIKFGGIFSLDHVSLARFTVNMRRAYDFGLVILKFATK